MKNGIYLITKNQDLFNDQSDIINCSITDCCNYLSKSNYIAVDTETEGFDFSCKRLLMLQIGDESIQFVIDFRTLSQSEIAELKVLLEDESIVKLLHNAKFDYKFIKYYMGIELNNIHDTYLCEKIINCGKEDYGYGLAKLVKRYLNIELDKSVRNRFVSTSSSPFTIDQIVYGANDVKYLHHIYQEQLKSIETLKLKNVASLENNVVVVFAEIEYNGLHIDREAWGKLNLKNKQDTIQYEKDLDKLLLSFPEYSKYKAFKQYDLFLPEEEIKDSQLNWGSPSQVLKLFRTIVPDLENVNGKKIAVHKNKHPLISSYIKYKEKSKLSSAFGDNFNNFISCDNMVRTDFSQILDTGRVSSSNPNMQQIPSTNEYRNCFTCEDGWVFVSSDYSSQELNVIAHGSKDPVFLKALELNQDLHSVCAELVFADVWHKAAEPDCAFVKANQKCECKEHKRLRTHVKTINFGLAYGMGPKKLSETINSSLSEAKDLINKYFKAFPKIKIFLDSLGEQGKRTGMIRTFPPFNRLRWFDNWTPKMYNDKDSFMELGSIERASKNTPIQGSSADMTKLALFYIYKVIKENNYPVKIVMTVHDQIDTICPEEFSQEWKEIMTEKMNLAAKVIIPSGLLKAETTITKKWSK